MDRRNLEAIQADLAAASAAGKCQACGCFQDAVAALETTDLRAPLEDSLQMARRVFKPRRYDCLGCARCWPADALNTASGLVQLPAGAGCVVEQPEAREGWPPYPGDVIALQFSHPVAVCTLHSRELVSSLAGAAPFGLSVVGSLQTENLGIERLIQNVVANPNLRRLVVCGEDTAGRIGHFPGQSLLSLLEHGVDDAGRILRAAGKRPLLQNIDRAMVEHFRRQVQGIDCRGMVDVAALSAIVADAASQSPPPMPLFPMARNVTVVQATPAESLVLDPAGWIVIFPDVRRGLLIAEHYENRGMLRHVVEGVWATDVMATLLRTDLVTRLDHAAYLGRELALAERALQDGSRYQQDRAPEGPSSCGCESAPESCSSVSDERKTQCV